MELSAKKGGGGIWDERGTDKPLRDDDGLIEVFIVFDVMRGDGRSGYRDFHRR